VYASRSGDGVVQVKVAGQTVTFNTPPVKGSVVEWNTVTYDFTATTAQTTLAFSNEQNPYVNFAFIDNVIVEKL
ncbi:MAG: dockerin, partial [Pseudomonas sp.]